HLGASRRRIPLRGASRERTRAPRAAHRARPRRRRRRCRHRPPHRDVAPDGGPTNVGPALAPTGAYTTLKSFLDEGSDVTSGAFRPLTVNAIPPVPCGGMVEVKYCVETAVMGALVRTLGGRVTGDLKGGGNHCYVGGPDPETGETFIFY